MKEQQHVEWKEAWRDDYLKWLCGFANAEGGVLVIGRNDPQVPLEASIDGLVPYSSSHLDGAMTELIVTSGHGVQRTPEAILEIRRIVREARVGGIPSAPCTGSLGACRRPRTGVMN